MVFQEESFASRWWPLGGAAGAKQQQRRKKPCDAGTERDALDLADSLEKGLAHEFTEEFLQPLEDSNTLRRFTVRRSDDRLQYRLHRDGGEFLMYAEVNSDAREVQFFLYDPDERENNLFDPEFRAVTNERVP
eukprot:TRINITY_DN25267_c0_g3_i1.p1 TRINITY_DN25267_c0_g3~~TRINITY_DN25267_c0_g3_i1.p1  ORF type:complete len:133 (-),score=37.25 TRINITY_DN25267_c0_g3_i1:266-664(-)